MLPKIFDIKVFNQIRMGTSKSQVFIRKVNKEGKSSCTFEDCPNSPTANIVQTFAGSNKVLDLAPFKYQISFLPPANVVQMFFKVLNILTFTHFCAFAQVWIEAFERVFNKMLAHGTDNLHDVQ